MNKKAVFLKKNLVGWKYFTIFAARFNQIGEYKPKKLY
jgi:hypothetical protein